MNSIPAEIKLLSFELGRICLEKSLKIAVAESCTGGGLCYALTEVPGSSQWFDRGFVSYSNNAKTAMLGVDQEIIGLYGAVSQEVAKQMAEGAIKYSEASISIAITGIAGPAGGDDKKPVGTCWFGFASHLFETQCFLEKFLGDRECVRTQAILFAFKKILALIER